MDICFFLREPSPMSGAPDPNEICLCNCLRFGSGLRIGFFSATRKMNKFLILYSNILIDGARFIFCQMKNRCSSLYKKDKWQWLRSEKYFIHFNSYIRYHYNCFGIYIHFACPQRGWCRIALGIFHLTSFWHHTTFFVSCGSNSRLGNQTWVASILNVRCYSGSTKSLVTLFVEDVHIVIPFAYLLLSYSKFEWAERGGTGSHKKAEL